MSDSIWQSLRPTIIPDGSATWVVVSIDSRNGPQLELLPGDVVIYFEQMRVETRVVVTLDGASGKCAPPAMHVGARFYWGRGGLVAVRVPDRVPNQLSFPDPGLYPPLSDDSPPPMGSKGDHE